MKIIIKPYELIHRCMVDLTKDDGSTEELHLTIFKNLDNGDEAYELTDGDGAYVSNELAAEVVGRYYEYVDEHKLSL